MNLDRELLEEEEQQQLHRFVSNLYLQDFLHYKPLKQEEEYGLLNGQAPQQRLHGTQSSRKEYLNIDPVCVQLFMKNLYLRIKNIHFSIFQ